MHIQSKGFIAKVAVLLYLMLCSKTNSGNLLQPQSLRSTTKNLNKDSALAFTAEDAKDLEYSKSASTDELMENEENQTPSEVSVPEATDSQVNSIQQHVARQERAREFERIAQQKSVDSHCVQEFTLHE